MVHGGPEILNMTKPTADVRPLPTLLIVRETGLLTAAKDEAPVPLDANGIETALATAEAVLFDRGAGRAVLPHRVASVLKGALETLPFFAVSDDSQFTLLPVPELTVFDRLIVTEPLAGYPASLQLVVPDDTADAILNAVWNDLSDDVVPMVKASDSYSPADYWEDRAQTALLPGRAVCYGAAPRHINKSMHAVHIKALDLAIRRASRKTRRTAALPTLLDYGCGIGRLASTCMPHVTYHGTDIAPSMIASARLLYPTLPFCTTSELKSAQFPTMDIAMLNTVLHHNPKNDRLAILRDCAALAGRFMRVILLEDFIGPNAPAANMFPVRVADVLDEIADCFGGSCTLSGMKLLGYKPNDYLQRTALFELEIQR